MTNEINIREFYDNEAHILSSDEVGSSDELCTNIINLFKGIALELETFAGNSEAKRLNRKTGEVFETTYDTTSILRQIIRAVDFRLQDKERYLPRTGDFLKSALRKGDVEAIENITARLTEDSRVVEGYRELADNLRTTFHEVTGQMYDAGKKDTLRETSAAAVEANALLTKIGLASPEESAKQPDQFTDNSGKTYVRQQNGSYAEMPSGNA